MGVNNKRTNDVDQCRFTRVRAPCHLHPSPSTQHLRLYLQKCTLHNRFIMAAKSNQITFHLLLLLLLLYIMDKKSPMPIRPRDDWALDSLLLHFRPSRTMASSSDPARPCRHCPSSRSAMLTATTTTTTTRLLPWPHHSRTWPCTLPTAYHHSHLHTSQRHPLRRCFQASFEDVTRV